MNKIIRLGLVLLMLVHSAAHAQASGPAPDVGAGKRRAAVCFACHNVDGVAKIPGVPNLAGQHGEYLEQALRAYRDGQTRQNPTMNAMAKPLSDRDIVNIAAYFSLPGVANAGATGVQASQARQVANASASTTNPSQTAVAAATPAAAGTGRSGEAVYSSVCFACHATGAAGAPKVGDRNEWLPRIAQGEATLLQHALQGIKAMPPRGGCAACSDADIKAAVAYMTAKSH